MNKKILKKVLIVFFIVTFTNSCGAGLSDAGKVLRNEKITNKDEFLVKKKAPLILPPDYNTLPTPGSKSKNKTDDSVGIDQILKVSKKSNSTKKSTTSVEKSIIDKIGK